MSPSSYLTLDGDWFRPTEFCRGPWTTDACHAGPPTGAIARAAEIAIPDKRLSRITVSLTRPIPYAGFRIETEIIKDGRATASVDLRVIDEADRVVTSAHALLLGRRSGTQYPTTVSAAPKLADAKDGEFPIRRINHGLTCFFDSVECRYPDGEDRSPGPTTLWLKVPPVLDSEPDSPFMKICTLADCGNAIGRNDHVTDFTAINPDLTLVVHRDPVGEWFGSSSVSRWEADGTGISDSLLFDEQGAVGRAIQTLLVSPTEPSSA